MLNSSFINNWVIPSGIYLALASGAGNPIRCHESSCEFTAAYLAIACGLVLIVPLVFNSARIVAPQLIALGLGAIIFAIIGCAMPMSEYVYSKAWGGIVASGFVLVFATHLQLLSGIKGLARGIARITLLVLALTLLFKASVGGGLLDRDVPYLLNGPIVFGWLMGLGTLCAFYLFFTDRQWISFIVSVALLLGVLWSGSKGPIIACVLSVFFLHSAVGGYSIFRIRHLLMFGVAVTAAVSFGDLWETLLESRFGLLIDIFENGINYSEGSVGARVAALELAFSLISENPITGIGVGGFANIDPVLMYPHNVHVEILLEYGFFIFGAYLLLILYGFVRGSQLTRSIILFYLICLSFSGDFSYLRYLLPFLLIGGSDPLPRNSNLSNFKKFASVRIK